MTFVGRPAVKLNGSEPQIKIVRPRRITARPTVTMTIANGGSPSIGRMKMRSSARPSAIADRDRDDDERQEGQAERVGEAEGDIGGQHHQFALGEIDDAGRLVDQREAHGDEAVGGAADQARREQQRAKKRHQAALP